MSHFSLALMLTILANGVLFFHAHELENGRIITHAHPILTEEQEDQPDHGHSEMELIILDLIAHADYFIYSISIEIPDFSRVEVNKNSGFVAQEFSQEVSLGFDLRGPPYYV
ncbi:hypothetical protein [Cecembia rubra]|uniref:Uncharacterized protein n=1 Tax=Cecembia rubra TaxID=1485585 RepID=A0A2P8E4S7_9BACT|nr:hypothetical protein [Cecembia rubra]PSL04461.1 hypothetical protein CLV48_105205 [Cecembia rubra]